MGAIKAEEDNKTSIARIVTDNETFEAFREFIERTKHTECQVKTPVKLRISFYFITFIIVNVDIRFKIYFNQEEVNVRCDANQGDRLIVIPNFLFNVYLLWVKKRSAYETLIIYDHFFCTKTVFKLR